MTIVSTKSLQLQSFTFQLDDLSRIADSDVFKQVPTSRIRQELRDGKDPNTLMGLDNDDSDPKPSFSQARILLKALIGNTQPKDMTEDDIRLDMQYKYKINVVTFTLSSRSAN